MSEWRAEFKYNYMVLKDIERNLKVVDHKRTIRGIAETTEWLIKHSGGLKIKV
ncbi:MAG: hypothetical protein ACP5JP_08320 [bacterium]